MQVFTPEATLTEFGPRFVPIGNVACGESFVVETLDCYGSQIDSSAVLRPDVDMGRFNQATGPVWVDGVTAGEWVRVHIERVEVDGPGVMAVTPGLGVLGHRVRESSTRLLAIKNGRAWLTDTVGIDLDPMVGIMGVATSGETASTSTPGDHGGNLDTRLIRPGASVVLRAHQDGAGLAVGDLHAAMGDGELGGTGIEIGGRVQLRVERFAHARTLPLVVTDDAVHVLASRAEVGDAVTAAFGEAVEMLAAWQRLEWPNAYRLASIVTDLEVSQLVNPRATVRVRIPRSWVPVT